MHELTRDHRSKQIRDKAELYAESCCHGGSLICPTPHAGTMVLDPGDAGFRRLLLEQEGMQFSQTDSLPLATEE